MKITPQVLFNAFLFSFIVALVIICLRGYVLHKQIPQKTVIIKQDTIVEDNIKFNKFDDSIK